MPNNPTLSSPLANKKNKTEILGVDVGGTFTDFVWLKNGSTKIIKELSTPEDPSKAILKGIEKLQISTGCELIHGSTVATNSLLERQGAKTALITSKGFKDVLAIGRQNRPKLYSLEQEAFAPLIGDDLRFELDERIDSDGNILSAIDEDEIRQLAKTLKKMDVESIAIVFLFSFINPAHEILTKNVLQGLMPDINISISSEILPEYREYERSVTTAINSYVQPVVKKYLSNLDSQLAINNIRIMQSSGGTIGINKASRQAARLALSGPAGGVVGAFKAVKSKKHADKVKLITFDMGGTSTDVALCSGNISRSSEGNIAGMPLRLPIIDIHTVGAGGGSIAWVDRGGALRTGPQSAGANPGPVCYNRKGKNITVTDANLISGRLALEDFLPAESNFPEATANTSRAMQTLATKINKSEIATALGVLKVANAKMERAIRRVSIERGFDPREFTLIPFGGAGPMHACDIAENMEINCILLLANPGVLSATGMTMADSTMDKSIAIMKTVDKLLEKPTLLEKPIHLIQQKLEQEFKQSKIFNYSISTELDMRYLGQSFELTVNFSSTVDRASIKQVEQAFHAEHLERYSFKNENSAVEIVNARVWIKAENTMPPKSISTQKIPKRQVSATNQREIWFDSDKATTVEIFKRETLEAGDCFYGPALLVQYDTTCLIKKGWKCTVDNDLDIWIKR